MISATPSPPSGAKPTDRLDAQAHALLAQASGGLSPASALLAWQDWGEHLATSPGPLATRAASGIPDFDALMDDAVRRAPLRRLVEIDDVGALCAFLAGDSARAITGSTLYVDAGYHILG